MQTTIDFIDIEIYTERLNDMYARIAEFISEFPNNRMVAQLKGQQYMLAIAHHRSRFYSDAKHLAEWDTLIRESEKLITEAMIKNVLY